MPSPTIGSTLAGLAARGAIANPFGRVRNVSNAATIQAVIDAAITGDTVIIEPGSYDEAVTIGAGKNRLTVVCAANRGSASIAPAAANAVPLTNHSDDVTLINVGCESNGTGGGILNTGRRFRAIGCKFEGGEYAAKPTLGTVAQIAALTRGKGDDCWWVDCEFCWTNKGVILTASDYGAVTQNRFRGCIFHDCADAAFEEADGTGGSAAVHFRDLDIGDCIFLPSEDGTIPTKYLSLNDDNGNMGLVHGCRFPVALNSGKSLVSTGLLWSGNLHPAGLSTGQPS